MSIKKKAELIALVAKQVAYMDIRNYCNKHDLDDRIHAYLDGKIDELEYEIEVLRKTEDNEDE